MKSICMLVLFLVLYCNSLAQNCLQIFKSAENASKKEQYREAILKYLAVKNCDPSYSKRADDSILVVFDKIEKLKLLADQRLKLVKEQKKELDETLIKIQNQDEILKKSDSIITANSFNRHSDLIEYLNQLHINNKEFILYGIQLKNTHSRQYLDTNWSYLEFAYFAKYYDHLLQNIYDKYSATSQKTYDTLFYKNGIIELLGFASTDDIQYKSWSKINLALSYFKDKQNESFYDSVKQIYDSVNLHIANLNKYYLMADSVIALPERSFYMKPSFNKQYFNVQIRDTADYRKFRINYKSISMDNFKTVLDSTIEMKDNGKIYEIISTYGKLDKSIYKNINYTLKPNRVDFSIFENDTSNQYYFTEPAINRHIKLEGYTPSEFTLDGSYLALFTKEHTGLALYNTITNSFISLKRSIGSKAALSISNKNNTIAYLGDLNSKIINADYGGNIISTIDLKSINFKNIADLDFLGSDRYLKLTNADKDSFALFDLKTNRLLKTFPSDEVVNITIDPSDTLFLLTYALEYKRTDDTLFDFVTFVMDPNFNIKYRLYTDCQNFFFTPNGKYLVGYNTRKLIYWDLLNLKNEKWPSYRSCLSKAQLINKGAISLNDFADEDDCAIVEKAARYFKDLAQSQTVKNAIGQQVTDTIMMMKFYGEALSLFGKLTSGKVRNVRKERIPIYYGWNCWIDNRMNNKNYGEQFIRAKAAVDIDEEFMDSKDSLYPKQIYQTAEDYYWLHNVYYKMGNYNQDHLDVLKREIELREKFKSIVMDHEENNSSLSDAYENISLAYDTIDVIYFNKKLFDDKINLDKQELHFALTNLNKKENKDFIEQMLQSSLRQLGATYIHKFIQDGKDNKDLLDSALHYCEIGDSYATENKDSVYFQLIKARVYLLQNGKYDSAIKIYDELTNKQCEHFPQENEKDHILKQLELMLEIGTDNPDVLKAKAYLEDIK